MPPVAPVSAAESAANSTAEVVSAHPVFEHAGSGFPPLLMASITAWLVFVVAFALPERAVAPAPSDETAPPLASWPGRLTALQWAGRLVAVVVLLVTIAAARLGSESQLENIAPALVVGTAWPLLVLVSVVVGPVWRWLDPFDGLARLLGRGPKSGPESAAAPHSVWPAALLLLPWVWYLSAAADPLAARSVGIVLAAYTAVTLAGCVALGRERFMSRAEPLAILLSWLALLPRGRLARWEPPPGAEALLGVLIGGVGFRAIRISQQWTGIEPATGGWAWAYALLALLGSCAVVTVLLMLARRLAVRVDGAAGIARAVVPAAAAVVLAVALGRNRLTSSVQLLPGLAGDPFGFGWDLLGPSVDGLNPAPLGVTGLLAAQVAVLVVGHLVGAFVVAWRLGRRARMPATVVLALLMAVTTVAVPTHS